MHAGDGASLRAAPDAHRWAYHGAHHEDNQTSFEVYMANRSSQSICLLDNWSLECAAVLLEEGVESIRNELRSEYLKAVSESILIGQDISANVIKSIYGLDVYFGALANLLISLVMFDEVIYVKNGFEAAWHRFPAFAKKLSRAVLGQECPDSTSREIEKKYSQLSNPSILYYSFLAKVFGADILLNPLRAKQLIEASKSQQPSYGQFAFDLLKVLDKSLEGRIHSLNSDLLRTGTIPNLSIPPVAALVYSRASSKADILDIAIDIRNSSQARNLRKALRECVGDLKATTKYPRLAEEAVSAVSNAIRNIGILNPDEKGVSVGLSLMFVSFSYDIGKPTGSYLLFLRDLAKCRLELSGSSLHVERLFNYSYQDADEVPSAE